MQKGESKLEEEVEQRSSEEEESSSSTSSEVDVESAEEGSSKTDEGSNFKKYSLKEDKKLLSLISQTGRHHEYKSHGLWEDLAKFNVLNRSADSMRARFHRVLIRRLGALCSKKECKLYREAGIRID